MTRTQHSPVPPIAFPVPLPDPTAAAARAVPLDPAMTAPSTWLPPLDLAPAVAEVEAAVRDAIARGALDEAHGEVVDRLVADLADGMAQQTHTAYLARLRDLDDAYRLLLARRAALADEVAALGDEAARLAAVRDAAWVELVGDDLHPDVVPVRLPATAVASALTGPVPARAARPAPAAGPRPQRRPAPGEPGPR